MRVGEYVGGWSEDGYMCVWVCTCVKLPRSVVSSYLTIVRLIKRAPAAITASSAGVRARSRAAALL